MASVKKQIVSAVCAAYNIEPAYLDLVKINGTYYWSGVAGSMFADSCTYIRYLGDWTLSHWVESFNTAMSEWSSDNGLTVGAFNTEIDKRVLSLNTETIEPFTFRL